MGISFRLKPLQIPLSRRTYGKRLKPNRLPDNLRQYVLDLLSTGPTPKRDLDHHIKSVSYAADMMLNFYEDGLIGIKGTGRRGDRKMYYLTQKGYDETIQARNKFDFD